MEFKRLQQITFLIISVALTVAFFGAVWRTFVT